MAGTLFCLDVHRDSLVAVVVDKSTKINLVTGCGAVALAGQTFAEALDQIRKQTGFVSGTSIVTYGAELFSFRNLTLPFTDRKKIEQVLPLELDDRLPVDMKSMVVDFIAAKEGPDGADVIAAMITRQYLAENLSILKSRGLDPDVVSISGLSTIQEIIDMERADSFVFIDIGTEWATLFIVLAKRIALIRSITVPAKRERQEIDVDDFFLSVRQTLLASRLLDLDIPSYAVYLAGLNHSWVDTETLSHSLGGVEVRHYAVNTRPFLKLEPVVQAGYQAEVMDRVLASGLIGVARNRAFNFRKDEFKKQWSSSEFRNLLLKGAAPLVLVIVAALGYWMYEYRTLQVQQDQLRSQLIGIFHETVPDVETIVNPVQQLQVLNKEIKTTYKPGGNNATGFTIVDLLTELSARIPASYKVKVVRLVADAETLRLKALTGDFNTVDNVQKELEKSRLFKDVVISSANQSAQNDEVSFELKLELARE